MKSGPSMSPAMRWSEIPALDRGELILYLQTRAMGAADPAARQAAYAAIEHLGALVLNDDPDLRMRVAVALQTKWKSLTEEQLDAIAAVLRHDQEERTTVQGTDDGPRGGRR